MISDADKAGRIMTSAAVVYVLPTGPLVENDVDEDVLDMKDVRIDLLKASGPGGQVSLRLLVSFSLSLERGSS